jgi:hypothetical protein
MAELLGEIISFIIEGVYLLVRLVLSVLRKIKRMVMRCVGQ